MVRSENGSRMTGIPEQGSDGQGIVSVQPRAKYAGKGRDDRKSMPGVCNG